MKHTLRGIATALREANKERSDRGGKAGRRRSKLVLTIPERASAAAASLQGRLRATNRRGGGGGEARNTGAKERNCSFTIAQKLSGTA
jgi:hypothetical protein